MLLLVCFYTTCLLYAQCGKVISVKDGDTFEILLSENQKQKVRIAYVDAPEHQQEFGDKSRQYLTKLVQNQKVCLDVKYIDPYKRSVAIVKLSDGRNVNELLIKNGMAWHFVKYSADKNLADLELKARKAKIGVWASANPTAPWLFRKQHHIGFRPKVKRSF